MFLADDHEMVARGLAAALNAQRDVDVVGIAGSVRECLRAAPDLRPDVVVLDLRLGDGDGVDAARELRGTLPDVNVVILTAYPEPGAMAKALEAGCCGFVAKSASLEELIAAVRAAANGSTTFPRAAVERAMRHEVEAERRSLSARELDVLRRMAAGQTTSTIADELGLSLHTTRNHVRNLMFKLGAHSRLDAVVAAARAGLIDLPDHD